MSRMEYKLSFYTISFRGIDAKAMQEECNRLAAEGWRMASAVSPPSQVVIFWEREAT